MPPETPPRRAFLTSSLAVVSFAGAGSPVGYEPEALTAADADPECDSRVAVERVWSRVAAVRPPGQSGWASGFVGGSGLVVTARHVMGDRRAAQVWLNGIAYNSEVLGSHNDQDLAILRLTRAELLVKPVTLAASESMRPGEQVVVLAATDDPSSKSNRPGARLPLNGVLVGTREVTGKDGKKRRHLVLSAPVRQGDSGSPVVRVSDGSVLGVLVSRDLPDDNGISRHAYAVEATVLEEWLKSLPAGNPDRFYLEKLIPPAK